MRYLATFAALVLVAISATPVAADGGYGYCNPGRASNPGTVTTYVEATWTDDPSFIDDITATMRDADPFTEAPGGTPSSSRYYVSLRRDANNYFQFGVVKRSASTWRAFVRAKRQGTFFYQEFTNAELAGKINDGPLDGDGDLQSFRINRDAGGDYMRGSIDGNGVAWLYAETGTEIFEPNFARVAFEIDNGGSEWWGTTAERQVAKDIHATRGIFFETVVPFDPPVNNTNKAHTQWVTSGQDAPYFYIDDEDC